MQSNELRRAAFEFEIDYFAISQMQPAGSMKLAVRIPQGRSIGPFTSFTPRLTNSAHIASTSSTLIVNTKRHPDSRFATLAGSISVLASVIFNRLIKVPPNLNTAELRSS